MDEQALAAAAEALMALAARRETLEEPAWAARHGGPGPAADLLARIRTRCLARCWPDLTALIVRPESGLPAPAFFAAWEAAAGPGPSWRALWGGELERVQRFPWAQLAGDSGPPGPAPAATAPPGVVPWLCVLGQPVAHTLSPTMHAAGFAATGRPGRYGAYEVSVARLPRALAGLAALGAHGCNLTVPLKEAGCALAGRRSPEAALTGSANTLAFRADGEVYADTTDGRGLLRALEAEVGWRPAGARVVLLGAGGAARAIAAALSAGGAARVDVVNRTEGRALRLATEIGGAVRAAAAGEPLARALAGAELLVNCTTLGLHGRGLPLDGAHLEALPPRAVVCDIVYVPEETPLLRAARARGLVAVGGLGMLAWQAALAWEVWFGETGPADVFLAAARAALGGATGPEAASGRGL